MNDIRLVESAVSELEDLNRDSRLNLSMRDQIDRLLSELRFVQLYVQCLAKWNDALQGKKNRDLGSARKSHIKATLAGATKGLYGTGVNALATQDFQQWNDLASDLHRRIQRSKPKIKEDFLYLLNFSFQCRFSNFELQRFFSDLSISLDEIVRLKSGKIVDIEMQIQGVKEKLHFFAQIFELTRKVRSSNKDLKDFNIRIQAWAYKAACLSLLYWVQEDSRQEKPLFFSTPEVIRLFLAVLKHLWSLSHNPLLMNEGVPKFVDFLLEILQLLSFNTDVDGIQILHRNLIFLTAFLVNPPTAEEYRDDAELISQEVQSLISSFNVNQIQGGTPEDLVENINRIKGKVSELYARIFLDSTSFDFPRINLSGFINSLIDKLREISHSVPNHHIDFKMLEADLSSLRSFLNDVLIKNIDLDEDLWRRIINVAYRVEIAINMFAYLNDCVWYNLKFLSDVREEIDLINIDMEAIRRQQFDNIRFPNKEIEHISSHSKSMSTMDEIIVGFWDDTRVIVSQLLHESSHLKMVATVGTAGQGKTTLAKMVYSNPSVKYHFSVCSWCHVSPTYERKNILFDMLDGLLDIDFDISDVEDEVLAELLCAFLKGKRYLIVMDDVWDAEAWEDLKKKSFPDDNNGSRILLTTRNRKVAEEIEKQGNVDCFIHNLGRLSDSESWELLERKVFHDNLCPKAFADVGKRIARNCNGLPLAITIIARLLLEGDRNLDWWNQVADNVDSLIASKGGMDLVELSYKHLPEYLKPCFLYFGAFQAEKVIKERRLIQLWVSEGFIHKSDGKFVEDVAKEYLRDLVSRGLLVVTNRSSTGGIKTCQIEGMFYEFFLSKIKEEKFLHVETGDDLSSKTRSRIYKHYRICIQCMGDEFFASNPLGPCVHSLLFVPDYTCLNKGDLFSICNFTLLQVLDLEDVEFNRYFPDEVIVLVLLRYLAIWCPSGIFCIPPSIANLKYLETFRVKREFRAGDEICLPETFWKMKRLRHVDVGGFIASFSSDTDEQESSALENIQTFSSPSLSDGKDAEELLKRLPNVRKLRCRLNDSCDPNKNGFPALAALCRIESLNVRYVGSPSRPYALNLSYTLKKLTLAQFRIPWEQMSAVAELPNLEVLKLLKDSFVGEKWVVSGGEFCKLKFLKLCELNIQKWIASDEAFPCLEQLIVENCGALKSIPSVFGSLPTLNKIQVRWCKPPVADSAREIEVEQYDSGNVYFQAHIMGIF